MMMALHDPSSSSSSSISSLPQDAGLFINCLYFPLADVNALSLLRQVILSSSLHLVVGLPWLLQFLNYHSVTVVVHVTSSSRNQPKIIAYSYSSLERLQPFSISLSLMIITCLPATHCFLLHLHRCLQSLFVEFFGHSKFSPEPPGRTMHVICESKAVKCVGCSQTMWH